MAELLTRAAAGARPGPGIGTAAGARRSSRRRGVAARPIPGWLFAAVAVASFGGPLGLAALNAPSLARDAGGSAGLTMLLAAAIFLVPLLIWLRYTRHVAGSGGLYAFVEAAAGRRVALVQATVWVFSYLLYLIYTTVQIVYDVLPSAVAGERRYQTLLALAIPLALVTLMAAGRMAALGAIAVIAIGQVVLAAILDGVTLAHLPANASSFGTTARAGAVTDGSAQTSLLYICGSLPLFLGGELATPARTLRRGLIGAYALTAALVTLAVAPLASAPGLMRTDLPGVSIAQQFAGPGVAQAVGIGVAASIAGVMLCEYVALTRLLGAVSGARRGPITLALGAVLLAAAPLTLIDPQGFYGALLKPSLVALWLSQLIVFAVYPRFAARHGGRGLPAWSLGVMASGIAIYGLITTLQQAST